MGGPRSAFISDNKCFIIITYEHVTLYNIVNKLVPLDFE